MFFLVLIHGYSHSHGAGVSPQMPRAVDKVDILVNMHVVICYHMQVIYGYIWHHINNDITINILACLIFINNIFCSMV